MSISQKSADTRVDKTSGPTPSAHPDTTNVPDPDDADPRQLEQGKKAAQDADSERVDTDCYNTSGNDADPPKTSERKEG